MRKVCFLLLTMVIIVACRNEEFNSSELSETIISNLEPKSEKGTGIGQLKFTALTGQTEISLEEAKNIALFTASQMRITEGITTKAPLKIESVEVISKNSKAPYLVSKGNSKKSEADLYLLNFENNQGYVLTSADRRVPAVFAYSSEGTLKDTITNPGVNLLLERVMYYIDKKKKEFQENRLKLAIAAQEDIFKGLSKKEQEDLISKGLFDKNGKRIVTKRMAPIDCFELYPETPDGLQYAPRHQPDPIYTYGPWNNVYVKNPLVKTLWNQSGDYNNKVSFSCQHDEAPVGCVATAVGQIMGYHKKPNNFKGRTMHWTDMTEPYYGAMFSYIYDRNATAKEDIQHLLAKLGDYDLLDMGYGCNGSGSNISKAFRTFKKLGYDANIEGYNSEKIISEIKNNRPVYVRGCSIRTWIDTPWWEFWTRDHYEYSECHAWVVDGYVKRTRNVTVTRFDECLNREFKYSYDSSIELIHNNFGWGGSPSGNNTGTYTSGWYYKGLFDANNGPEGASNSFKSGTSGNFQFENKIITNIK